LDRWTLAIVASATVDSGIIDAAKIALPKRRSLLASWILHTGHVQHPKRRVLDILNRYRVGSFQTRFRPQPTDVATMYSSLHRLNNLSTFLTTCLLALLAAISLSSFLLAASPTGALEVAPVKMYRRF
jgi:uncharacterized membrane protein YbhN (UPF0104 family)